MLQPGKFKVQHEKKSLAKARVAVVDNTDITAGAPRLAKPDSATPTGLGAGEGQDIIDAKAENINLGVEVVDHDR